MKRSYGTHTKAAAAAILVLAGALGAGAATNDILIGQADSPDPVRVGQDLTYRIDLTNRGPEAVSAAVVTDIIPLGADFVSCNPSQGTWDRVGDTITCAMGAVAAGGTANVYVVVRPTGAGTITNQASLSGDTGTDNNRSYAATLVRAVNRWPEIALPGPHVLAVGSTTSFVVTASDPDHDPGVTITNTAGPSGATYVLSNFAWTASAAAVGTTSVVTFVANDGEGETNSIVTNSTTIVVPFDFDVDGLGDDWEWGEFSSLTNQPGGDFDGDGADNRNEYVAGTQATNQNSSFAGTAESVVDADWEIAVSTRPGRKYTIEYSDGNLVSGLAWSAFANSANGIGTWLESNPSGGSFAFTDDHGANTTGGQPAGGTRLYRIRVEVP